MDDLPAIPASFARLLGNVRSLDEPGVRAPSRLPGWSRGHLLTHLARSADAMGNVVTWAVTGVETPGYASPQAREADIAAGADRSPDELVDDLVSAHARLLDALTAMTDDARNAAVRIGPKPLRGGELAFIRLRELELHHIDLDIGYAPQHWPEIFVVTTLDAIAARAGEHPAGVSRLQDSGSTRCWDVASAGVVLHGSPHALLAWATGRRTDEPLTVEPDGDVPASPGWL